jgi:predicted amidohydrolase
MNDLIIKSGTVIDPVEGINGVNDVAVENGNIAVALVPRPVNRPVEVWQPLVSGTD